MSRRLMAFVAVLVALLAVAPIASAGDHKDKGSRGWYDGNTTLDVDPGTLEALGSLGVTPGAIHPATLEGARYGKVNGAGPVALLDLDYRRVKIRFDGHKVKVGPVGTTLTQGAADALNEAFGTDALSDDTVIGDVKIRYRAVHR